MRTSHRLAFLALPILPAVWIACVSSDNPNPAGADDGGSAGHDSGVVTPGDDSGITPGNDGGTTDGGGGGDDGGTPASAFTQCEPVETLAQLSDYVELTLATSGDQQVVFYGQQYGDGGSYVAGRAFDGSSWLPEFNVGSLTTSASPYAESDGAGHAWVMLMDQFFSVHQFDYDFSTHATSAIVPGLAWSIAAVAPGQAMSVYADNTRILHADRWYADGGVVATGLSAPGSWDMAVKSNGKGAAVAKWSHITGTKVDYVGVAGSPADGGAWSVTGTTDAGVGSNVDRVMHAVLSNGDAVLVVSGAPLQVGVFHAATGTVGSMTTLDANGGSFFEDQADHWIVVDSHDRVTVGWQESTAGGHLLTSRSLNGGVDWSAPEDVGAGDHLRFAIDPATERVAVLIAGDPLSDGSAAHGYGLRLAGPTDTKWSTMFTTNLSDQYVGYVVPMAFTSKGLRIVSSVDNPDGGRQTYLMTTVCN